MTGIKWIELSGVPLKVKHGEWALKVVPWIGGRIISMEHLPTGKSMLSIFGPSFDPVGSSFYHC